MITDSKALIKKYDEQLKNIRNNREFDSLNKEIEFQNLEQAEKIRELFQNNTTHSSVYEIRQIGHGTSTGA